MNEKRILLVHGIHAKEGESNVWNMKKPLEKATGLPVVVFEYGYLHAVQARFENPTIAKRLAHVMEPGDIIVNHSNGAAVTWLATHKEGARPAGVVMLQRALGTVQDGTVGAVTLRLAKGSKPWHWARYMAFRAMRYQSTRNFDRFGEGWLTRIFSLAQDV